MSGEFFKITDIGKTEYCPLCRVMRKKYRDAGIKNVTVLGGHDGFDVRTCDNVLVEDCGFYTGDDCIAGINIRNMTVRRCVLNTSCNLFRIGGVGITVEDVYAYGPGYYPHRRTVVKGRGEELALCTAPVSGAAVGVLCSAYGHDDMFRRIGGYSGYTWCHLPGSMRLPP